MRMRSGVVGVCVLAASFAYAEVRRELVDKAAAEFAAFAGGTINPVGPARGDLEAKVLSYYLVDPGSIASRAKLTLEEFNELQVTLKAHHGFTLAETKLSERSFGPYKEMAERERRLFKAETKEFGLKTRTYQDWLRAESGVAQRENALGPDVTLTVPRSVKYVFELGPDGRMTMSTVSSDKAIAVPLRQRGKNNLDAAFHLLAATPNGLKMLEKLGPALLSGEVEVRELDSTVRARSAGFTRGRCETTTSGKRVIFVDPLDPPLVIATVLSHEISHVLSPEEKVEKAKLDARKAELDIERKTLLAAIARRQGVSVDKANLNTAPEAKAYRAKVLSYLLDKERETFRKERAAHDVHERFIREAIAIFPDSKAYFDYIDTVGTIPSSRSDDAIIRLYRLNLLAQERARSAVDCKTLKKVAEPGRP